MLQGTNPLQDLQTAAREVGLSTGRRAYVAWDACDPGRRWAALLIDQLLVGAFMFFAFLAVLWYDDFDGPPSRGAIGVAVNFIALSIAFLLYTSTDWIIGTTIGKAMWGIVFETRAGHRRIAVLKRWLFKSFPFILCVLFAIAGLIQAELETNWVSPRPNHLNGIAVVLLCFGLLWWLLTSVLTFGADRQTLPDILVGTRQVVRQSTPSRRGFEPILIAAPVAQEDREAK